MVSGNAADYPDHEIKEELIVLLLNLNQNVLKLKWIKIEIENKK